MCLQNGIDAAEIVARRYGARQVIGAVVMINGEITAPGVIRHNALNRLTVGELDGRQSARLARLVALATRAGDRDRVESRHPPRDLAEVPAPRADGGAQRDDAGAARAHPRASRDLGPGRGGHARGGRRGPGAGRRARRGGRPAHDGLRAAACRRPGARPWPSISSRGGGSRSTGWPAPSCGSGRRQASTRPSTGSRSASSSRMPPARPERRPRATAGPHLLEGAQMRFVEERDFTLRLDLRCTFEEGYDGELDGYAWLREFQDRILPRDRGRRRARDPGPSRLDGAPGQPRPRARGRGVAGGGASPGLIRRAPGPDSTRPAGLRTEPGRPRVKRLLLLRGRGRLPGRGSRGRRHGRRARSFVHFSIDARTVASLSLASAGEFASAVFAAASASFVAFSSASQAFFTSGFIFFAAACACFSMPAHAASAAAMPFSTSAFIAVLPATAALAASSPRPLARSYAAFASLYFFSPMKLSACRWRSVTALYAGAGVLVGLRGLGRGDRRVGGLLLGLRRRIAAGDQQGDSREHRHCPPHTEPCHVRTPSRLLARCG